MFLRLALWVEFWLSGFPLASTATRVSLTAIPLPLRPNGVRNHREGVPSAVILRWVEERTA